MTSPLSEQLFSEQSYIYGLKTLSKISDLKVFIYGLRGIGIETAKNIILTGVKHLVIQDSEIVQLKDLALNCFCREEHVGHMTRAQASVAQLRSLSSDLDVNVHEAEVTTEFLERFNVVVFTDFYDKKKLIEFNNFCRNRVKPIGFIYTGCLGLCGFIFVDFGPSFTILDVAAEKRKRVAIYNISNECSGKVTIQDKRHGFEDEDYVKFEDVEGMTEINQKVYRIQVINPFEFNIECDTTSFGKYIRCGFAKQIKKSQTINFDSLEASLLSHKQSDEDSTTIRFDSKTRRPGQLHSGLKAILEFYEIYQTLPRSNNEQDAEQIISLLPTKKSGILNEDNADYEFIRNLSRFARGQISPLTSFFGGITAIEITKYTGKFIPLRQWLHYDIYDLLPEPKTQVTRNVYESRYEDQIAIFGKEFQENLMSKKLFLVGTGGLGCEFIKQFALTGLCCGPEGRLTCTDDDTIEMRNLSTSCLFQKEDIGKFKSKVACEVGKKLNKNLHLTSSLSLRMNSDTSSMFNDDFWEEIDAVVCAVNNVNARVYLDSKCVFYRKNLFESRTDGMKGHTQVVIPFETQIYDDSVDPQESLIPLDILKNFPYESNHTIVWARDYFEEKFVQIPKEYQNYRENPNKYIEKLQHDSPHDLIFQLKRLEEFCSTFANPTHEACIKAALEMFQEVFYNKIVELIHSYPADYRNANDTLFWSGYKRCPKPLVYDPLNDTHAAFIFSTANLFALMFNLPAFTDRRIIADLALSIKTKVFKPPEQINFNQETQRQEKTLILKCTRSWNLPKVSVTEYQKDGSVPFQLDFISASSNLRARNYSLKETSRRKIKAIVENMIPKIAAIEAIISSAITIEIFKLVAEKGVHIFKNTYCNFAVPMLASSEPMLPVITKDTEFDRFVLGPTKAIPHGFTKWEKIDIKGPMKIQQIIEYIREKYGVNIQLLAMGETIIYHLQITDKHVLELTPEEWFQKKKGKNIPDHTRYMEIMIAGVTPGDEVDVSSPNIRYIRNN